MAVRKLRNSWWVDFRHDGIRHRKRSPDNTKAGAQAYEALLRSRLASDGTLVHSKTISQSVPAFATFATQWFDVYVRANNKPSEIHSKKYKLQSSLVPFFGELPLNKINTYRIEQFKAAKLDDGFSAKTINNHLAVLSKCLATAKAWGILRTMPSITLLKTPPCETRFLTHQEGDLLLYHLPGRWREIALTALKTGLRMGELRGLSWDDVDWNTRTIIVRHAWCGVKKALVSPKSNKHRRIPMTNDLYEMLYKKCEIDGLRGSLVFADGSGNKFYDERFNRELEKACLRAQIKTVTCHTLRHSFASHLAMAGTPMAAIQKLLGHSDIQTSMRYSHITEATLVEAIRGLELGGTPQNFGQPVVN